MELRHKVNSSGWVWEKLVRWWTSWNERLAAKQWEVVCHEKWLHTWGHWAQTMTQCQLESGKLKGKMEEGTMWEEEWNCYPKKSQRFKFNQRNIVIASKSHEVATTNLDKWKNLGERRLSPKEVKCSLHVKLNGQKNKIKCCRIALAIQLGWELKTIRCSRPRWQQLVEAVEEWKHSCHVTSTQAQLTHILRQRLRPHD